MFIKRANLPGQKFGMLTVLHQTSFEAAKKKWLCRCDCGVEREAWESGLIKGYPRSCGCNRGNLISGSRTTHGKSYSREYSSWIAMRARCNHVRDSDFERYGGRGIKVCEQWISSFPTFLADMGPRPEGKSLDRIDVNKGYFPSNCRWSSSTEQNQNRRDTILFSHNGETKCAKEWAKGIGISYCMFLKRIHNGMPMAEALTKPPRGLLITHNGETKTIAEWAKITGVKHITIKNRYYLGWSPEKIFG